MCCYAVQSPKNGGKYSISKIKMNYVCGNVANGKMCAAIASHTIHMQYVIYSAFLYDSSSEGRSMILFTFSRNEKCTSESGARSLTYYYK